MTPLSVIVWRSCSYSFSFLLGVTTGELDGDEVGDLVGDDVGDFVGDPVGDFVGDFVGYGVVMVGAATGVVSAFPVAKMMAISRRHRKWPCRRYVGRLRMLLLHFMAVVLPSFRNVPVGNYLCTYLFSLLERERNRSGSCK